ncbi:MAG: type IV pilus assembly protein PilM [Patescibacteria group bacterium]
MKTAKTPYFFHDKPLFGLDIGHGSLKAMQLSDASIESARSSNKPPRVVGYGFAAFDRAAQEDGVIVKPEIIAKAAHDLFKNHLIGDITTRRVALAIPAYRTYTRSLQLPKLKPSELAEAVRLEAEQYISLPLEDLYLDYEIIRQNEDTTELFVVAVPRTIVDSYLELAQILGLETVLIEPTLSSSGRLFSIGELSDVATVIIDFGSLSSDISIFDKHVLVTGTVQSGGLIYTESIKKALNVSIEEAALIKTRYGLGVSKKQADIKQALEPKLQEIVKEVRRMLRYYEERYGQGRPVGQVISLGGGANMPGLSDYLTAALRIPARHTDPWQYLNYKGLQPPTNADKPMYATVVGLSLARPKEVFLS